MKKMINLSIDHTLKMNEREILFERYKNKIEIDYKLNRSIVSFQANKKESYYRWFKYKEGFSKRLVNYFIDKYNLNSGHILVQNRIHLSLQKE